MIRFDAMTQDEGLQQVFRQEMASCLRYFARIQEQKLLLHAFPGGEIQTKEDWVKFVADPLNQVALIVNGSLDNPIAHIHLTNFQGYVAMLHFCITREYHGRNKSIRLGRDTMELLSMVKRSDKTPYVKTVLGLTPASNRLAVKYSERIGFQHVDILPEAYWMAAQERFVDGWLGKLPLEGYRSISLEEE